MAFNFDNRLRYHIEGGEIQAFRERVEARRRSIQRQSKYAGQGRRGRGRKTLLRPIDKLSERVANFRDTTNFKYAKYIVEMAVKHGCGTIQIENLKGINERSAFLKSWPYHDLQTKIKNKAKEYGIKVVEIKPNYTSQRCFNCGVIDEDSRYTQAEFHCKTCGHTANADFNAAQNIAMDGIEQIIDVQLKAQRKYESEALAQ